MRDPPVAWQCQMLSLARSTAYYRTQEVSEADLALMRRIDALHLERPFAGSGVAPHAAAGRPLNRSQCAHSSTIRRTRRYWKPLCGIKTRPGAYSAPPAIRANCMLPDAVMEPGTGSNYRFCSFYH
jgi:hypothetical protein